MTHPDPSARVEYGTRHLGNGRWNYKDAPLGKAEWSLGRNLAR